MRSVFSTYHPIINFGFYCAVIGISIFMIHPVFLTIGVAAALAYAVMLGGKNTLKFFAVFLLPMILVVAVINPLVNQQGATILFYIGERCITMESVVYGLLTGMMLASIMLWFSSYNKIMTSDKFVYLFGRIMPAISLMFSMVMRFIPNYKAQITKISNSQKCIGRDVSNGTTKEKARHGIKIISIMFTWALESAIDTADSMRSRGYGMKNRTSFSIYRFDRRDLSALITLMVLAVLVIAGAVTGHGAIEMYPEITMAPLDPVGAIMYASYLMLCFLPVIIEVKEIITWQRLKSRI